METLHTYEKTQWKNRAVQRPRTYTSVVNGDGSRTDTPAPGNVTEPGTPVNAENLNHIEDGIKDAYEDIAALNDDLYEEHVKVERIDGTVTTHTSQIAAIQVVDAQQTLDIGNLTTAHNALAEDEASLKSRADAHIANRGNPHQVTKSQVGLGNVPNVTTNNQTPTFTEAGSNQLLTSGEKLSAAFGKLARAVRQAYAHIADRNNPHQVTKAQVGLGDVPNVTTNNQLPTFTEADSDQLLVSGEDTLSVLLGKIARAVRRLYGHIADRSNPHEVWLTQAAQAMFPGYLEDPPDLVSSYVGTGNRDIIVNGATWKGQYVDIGFAPSKVVLFVPNANEAITPGMSEKELIPVECAGLTHSLFGAAVFAPGYNYFHEDCGPETRTCPPQTLLAKLHGGAAVYSNGFVVQVSNQTPKSFYPLNTAVNGARYYFWAWR